MEFIGVQNEKLKLELECQMRNMHFTRLQNEKLKDDLVNQSQELEQQAKEMEKQRAKVDLERKNLLAEKKNVCLCIKSTQCLFNKTVIFVLVSTRIESGLNWFKFSIRPQNWCYSV